MKMSLYKKVLFVIDWMTNSTTSLTVTLKGERYSFRSLGSEDPEIFIEEGHYTPHVALLEDGDHVLVISDERKEIPNSLEFRVPSYLVKELFETTEGIVEPPLWVDGLLYVYAPEVWGADIRDVENPLRGFEPFAS